MEEEYHAIRRSQIDCEADPFLISLMVLILDGGSTSVLDHLSDAERAELMDSPLWTSQALFSHPAAVLKMYREYISSGADLVSCMTYQQSEMTMKHLHSLADAYDVGMRIALESCVHTNAMPVLTLGTHAAMLGNGAEYSHTYEADSLNMLRAFHSKRLQQFASMKSWPAIQYIAFETLPDVLEAEAILDVLYDNLESLQLRSKKIWISFSCSGEGAVEKVLEGVRRLLAHEKVQLIWGLGVNCFKEDKAAVVEPFCELLAKYDLYAVIYRDAGPQWDAVQRKFIGQAMDTDAWAETAARDARLNLGRIIIGGCCQTTPLHIAALRSKVTVM